MKRKMAVVLLSVCMVCSLAACGDKKSESTEGTESVGETVKASRTKAPDVSSVNMGVDPKEQVGSLCEYKGIEVTITGKYEVTDEEINTIIMSDLSTCGANLVKVTDRDTVEKDDIVCIDYTGYVDGEAFDNGAATDQYIDVADNTEHIYGIKYIDGFSDALVGAKVGAEVTSQVTFPEDYTVNTDLAGKDASFEMKVNGIYREEEDLDKLTKLAEDEDSTVNTKINDMYSSHGITNLEQLVEYEKSYVDYTLNSNKYNDTVSAIKQYMLDNCEVGIPEDYLQARLTEYVISYENDNLDDTQELEDYLQDNYQVSTDEAMETWKEYEEEQIKTEFIFSVIADKEGMELDEDEFANFISGILSSDTASSYGFEEEDDIYEYYGAGVVDNGKKYMRSLYLMNKAIDYVCENAKVNVEAPAETTEGTEEE